MSHRLLHGTLAAAAIVMLSGCGSSTSPASAFDPITADSTSTRLFAPMDSNQALQSIAELSTYFSLTGAPPALGLLPRPGDADTPSATLDRLRGVGIALDAADIQSILPSNVLGKTFVYNPNTPGYELSDSTGAPSNGVRFILYAVDPVLHRVLTPLNAIGYVDFIDEGSDLRITAVVNGVTYVDYTVSLAVSVANQSFQLNASGYVSDGTRRVNFTVAIAGTATGGTLDYVIEDAAGSGSLHLFANATSTTSLATTLTITSGSDRTIVQVAQSGDTTNATVTGTITYNGQVVINISGPADGPNFSRPDGTALTDAEVAALRAIGDFIGAMGSAFIVLLAPALFAYHISVSA